VFSSPSQSPLERLLSVYVRHPPSLYISLMGTGEGHKGSLHSAFPCSG